MSHTVLLLLLLLAFARARNTQDVLSVSGQPLWIDARNNDGYYKEAYTGGPFPPGVTAQDAWTQLTGLVRNHQAVHELDEYGGISPTTVEVDAWSWEDSFRGTDGGKGVPANHATFPDGFGSAVLLREDGDGWAFVASSTETVSSAHPLTITGAVYIYRRQGGPYDWRWQFHQKLTGQETPTGSWNGHNTPGEIFLGSDGPWLSVGHQREGNLYVYKLDDASGFWMFSQRVTGSTEAVMDAKDNRIIYRTSSDSTVRFARLDSGAENETLPATIAGSSSFFYQRDRDLLYVYNSGQNRYNLYRPWLSGTLVLSDVTRGGASTRVIQCASKDRLWVYVSQSVLNVYLYDLANNDYRNGSTVDLSSHYTGGAITSLSCSDDWLIVGSGHGNGSFLLFSEKGVFLRGWTGMEQKGMAAWSLSPQLSRFVPIGSPSFPQAFSSLLSGGGFSTTSGHVDLYSAVPWFRISDVQEDDAGQWSYDDLSLVRLAVHSDVEQDECVPTTVVVGSPVRARDDFVALWQEEGERALVDPTSNDMVRGLGSISFCFLPDPEILSLFSILPAYGVLGTMEPDDEAEAETFSDGRITPSGIYLLAVSPRGTLYHYSGTGIAGDLLVVEDKITVVDGQTLDARGKRAVVGIPARNSTLLYTGGTSSTMAAPPECLSSFGRYLLFQTDHLLLISCQIVGAVWKSYSIDLARGSQASIAPKGDIGPRFVQGSQGDILVSLNANGMRVGLARRTPSTDRWEEEQSLTLPAAALWAHVSGGRLAVLFSNASMVGIYQLRNLSQGETILSLPASEKRVHLLGPAGDVLQLSPSGRLFGLFHNDSWIDLGTGHTPPGELLLSTGGEGQLPLALTLDDVARDEASLWPYRPLIRVSPHDDLTEDTTVLCYYLTDSAGDGALDRGLIFLAKDAPPSATLASAVIAEAGTPVVQRSTAKLPDWPVGVIVALIVTVVVLAVALTFALAFLITNRKRSREGSGQPGKDE